jgi:glycosyltransferase involved in cell wall biosynthesis
VDSSDDKRKPKLLLVAYDFPPVASAGMYRIVGMTKYLQRMGWDITVLTVKNTFVFTAPESLNLIPPGVRVIRTASFDFRRFAHAVAEKTRAPWDSEGKSAASARGRLRQVSSRVVNLILRAVDRLFRFPDIKAGWSIPLFVNTWRLLGRERFDVVLSSSPPHSLHLPLLFLRKVKRFKWVADFRDPWTAPVRTERSGLGDRIRRVLERSVLSTCDFVVANTPGNREALAETFGGAVGKRTVVITNGLDLELDAPDADENVPPLDCEIVYVGELYDGMLDVYVEAIRYLRDRNRAAVPRLWVYGGRPSPSTLRAVRRHGLDEWVVYKGRVPYQESRMIVKRAPALLLVLPHRMGHGTWVPSKLYSYLFSRAPILALVPEGDAAKIIEATRRGLIVRTTEPCDVAKMIEEFLAGAERGAPGERGNEEEIGRFRMDVLAERVDAVLRRSSGGCA